MTSKFGYVLYFAALVLLQVLIFNNIEIAGLISPFIYIYFILILPMKTKSSYLLLYGFLMGLIIDIFSNTFGIHAAATTFAAFLRPHVLKLYSSQEDMDKYAPTLKYIGGNFIKYSVTIIFIHHFSIFMLEAFSFSYIWMVLLKTAVSSVITLLLIWAVERLKN